MAFWCIFGLFDIYPLWCRLFINKVGTKILYLILFTQRDCNYVMYVIILTTLFQTDLNIYILYLIAKLYNWILNGFGMTNKMYQATIAYIFSSLCSSQPTRYCSSYNDLISFSKNFRKASLLFFKVAVSNPLSTVKGFGSSFILLTC